MLTPIPFPVRKWKPAPNLVSPQGSPQVFLESPSVSRTRCLILDTCLLECQDRSCSENRLSARCEFQPFSSVLRPMSIFMQASELRVRSRVGPSPSTNVRSCKRWVPRCESLDPA